MIGSRLQPPALRLLCLLVVPLLCAWPAAAQSPAALFTRLPAGFGHLFAPVNAIILGTAGGASLAVHPKDDDIARSVYAATGARETFFDAGAPAGDIPAQGAFALATYVVGYATHRPRVTSLGADLIDAQIVNGVLTQGLKVAVNRTRPNGSSRGFPSGHTSSTFATAAVIQRHLGWKASIPFYALGTYVSASRMVDNEHFASDVIFGAAIGMISGRAASFGHGVSVTAAPILGGAAIVGRIGKP
jgi:membrane-associated phospholipid phosphatase